MNWLKPKKAAFLNSTTLILVGILGYYYNSTSITALIPVFLGLAIFLCYLLYDKNNKIFSHIAVTLMFLALIGLVKPLTGAMGRSDVYAMLRIGLMQLVSLYSIICFIVSFIEARKNNS